MANSTKDSAERSTGVGQALFLNEELADVWFEFGSGADKKRVPGFKAVMASQSPVFKAMFYGPLKEEGDVAIVGVSADEFIEFLRLVHYKEAAVLTIENVVPVMTLADQYQTDECLQLCDTFLAEYLPIDHICSAYQLAMNLSRRELQAKLDRKIGEQTKAVLASSGFRECSRDVLNNILKIEIVSCSAMDVFSACMNWAGAKCSEIGEELTIGNMKSRLGESFRLIPFYLMNPKEIASIAADENHKGLFDQDEMVDLMKLMVVDVPIKLTKFEYKACFSSSLSKDFCWNELYLDWLSFKGIDKVERHTFTGGNRDLVAVKLYLIEDLQYESKLLSGTLSIKKKGVNGTTDSIILQQINLNTCLSREFSEESVPEPVIKLCKPILCEDNEVYEILFVFDSSWAKDRFCTHGQYSIVKGICFMKRST